MKYIGSHHGKVDDGYIGSGTYFRKAYDKNPKIFKREILEYNTDKDEPHVTYALEQKYLNLINDIHLNENYYNLTPNAFSPGGWSKGKKLSKNHRENIGKANKGKRRDQELIDQWREKMKLLNLTPWNKGQSGNHFHSSESKKKISEAVSLRHKTQDLSSSYKKISESKKGKTKLNDAGRDITSKKLKGNKNGAGRKNTPKGKIWINKDGISKMILPEEIKNYNSWNKGRK